MEKRKEYQKSKRKVVLSVLALVVCVAMLLGTTFAWFTDSVTSGRNRIVAGDLDIDVLHTSASVTTAESISEKTNLFRNVTGQDMLWEPGAVSYENFTVSNLGTVALKYKLAMNIMDYNALGTHTLKEVLKVKVLEEEEILSTVTREAVMALDWSTSDTLDVFKKEGSLYPSGSAGGASDEKFQVIVYWQPTDHDNDYNVNNGQKTSDEQPLFIDFGIDVVAGQLNYESDSFDSDYDKNLVLPDLPISVNKTFQSDPITTTSVTEEVTVKNKSTNTGVATMPAAAVNSVIADLLDQATDKKEDSDLSTVIYLSVQTTDKAETSVTYDVNLSAKMTYTNTSGETKTTEIANLDGHLGGQIVTAKMEIGKGLSNVAVYHNDIPMAKLSSASENAEGFYYDETTGELTIKSKSFSPIKVTYTLDAEASIGGTVYSTFAGAMAAAEDGDTILILKDIANGTITKNVSITSKGAGLAAKVDTDKKLTISEGTFASLAISSGVCEVTGGTFGTDPSAYVMPGYQAKKSETKELWTVSKAEAKYVAQIGSTLYETFDEAAAVVAAKSTGENVTMYIINDCSTSPKTPYESSSGKLLFKCNLTVEVLDGVTVSFNNFSNKVFVLNYYKCTFTLCGAGNVVINKGTLVDALNNGNIVTIQDVTINGTGADEVVWISSRSATNTINAKVKGCKLYDGLYNDYAGMSAFVEGGYYSHDISNLIPSNQELVTLGSDDPMYAEGYRYSTKPLSEEKAEAYIDRNGTKVYFANVADGLAYAKANETMVLIKDVTYTSTSPYFPVFVTGNTVPATLDLNGKTLTLTGGYLVVDGSDTLTIKNGSINATNCSAFNIETTSKLIAENLNVSSSSYVFECDRIWYGTVTGNVTVKSGTYSGTSGVFNGYATTSGKEYNFLLEGGTYNTNPPAAFIAPGKTAVDNGDGTWTVQ